MNHVRTGVGREKSCDRRGNSRSLPTQHGLACEDAEVAIPRERVQPRKPGLVDDAKLGSDERGHGSRIEEVWLIAEVRRRPGVGAHVRRGAAQSPEGIDPMYERDDFAQRRPRAGMGHVGVTTAPGIGSKPSSE